jgi:hypothetical protein
VPNCIQKESIFHLRISSLLKRIEAGVPRNLVLVKRSGKLLLDNGYQKVDERLSIIVNHISFAHKKLYLGGFSILNDLQWHTRQRVNVEVALFKTLVDYGTWLSRSYLVKRSECWNGRP